MTREQHLTMLQERAARFDEQIAQLKKDAAAHAKAHRKGPDLLDPWDSPESAREAKRLGDAYLLAWFERVEVSDDMYIRQVWAEHDQ